MDISLYRTEVQNWIKTIQDNRGINPEITIEYCNKVEEYGKEIKDDALIGFACFSRGETYYLMNNMQYFYGDMLTCIPAFDRIGEWGYVAMANNLLGIMSLNRGNVPYAMDYYIKALTYCQKYHLDDIGWIVNMNIGELYIHIEDYNNALEYIEKGYAYILKMTEMTNRNEYLTAVYLAMAKVYLKMGDIDKSCQYNQSLIVECENEMSTQEHLMVLCYQAQLYNEQENIEKRNLCIQKIQDLSQKEAPVMDVFDDCYDYIKMLLNIEQYDDFLQILTILEPLIEKTSIKNLEKKLLTLRMQYYRKIGEKEAYMDAAVSYFELNERMERENYLMLKSIIKMRSNLNHLAEINKEVKKENIALHKKSETDALTNMWNRFKLNEYGEEAFNRAFNQQTSLAIEILDIDYFKQYNDNYGHQAGDGCITEIAKSIMELTKYGNISCFRYGGDEFVIIYESYTKEETLALAQELKANIVEKNIEHAFSLASECVTISQGICWDIPNEENKLWDYLHTADLMLYKVKAVSRNSIRLGCCNDNE